MNWLFLIVGIALTIIKENNILVIPDYIIQICYGVAILLTVVEIISYIRAKHEIKSTHNKLNRW
jgi:hypothetical protein